MTKMSAGRSRKLLLDYYAPGRVAEIVHIDSEKPDHLNIETVQDCEPIMEMAKRLSEESPQRGEVFRHVGFMPQIFMEKAMKEGWWNDMAEIKKRFLNNPDFKAFRTWPGRI